MPSLVSVKAHLGGLFLFVASLIASAAWAEAIDVTGQVTITRSGYVLNRTTNTFDQTLSIQNTGGQLRGPVQLVISTVTPSTVKLANGTGTMATGDSYVALSVPVTGLATGAKLTGIVLKFSNPARVSFVYQTRVMAQIAIGLLPGTPTDLALGNVPDLPSQESYSRAEFETVDGMLYLRSLITIGFTENATIGQINSLIEGIGGRIVGSLEKTALLAVRIPDPGSLTALNSLLASLKQAAFIDIAVPTVFPRPAQLPAWVSAGDRTRQYAEHHLAARAHAAWNARAILSRSTSFPAILVYDTFGLGKPDSRLFSLNIDASYFGLSPECILTASLDPCWHGYATMSVLGATFDGAQDSSPVAGMYPGPQALDLIVEPVVWTVTESDTKVISDWESLGRQVRKYARVSKHLVINTSVGYFQAPMDMGVLSADPDPRVWSRLWRHAVLGYESAYFHAAAAGNNPDMPARQNAPWTMAGLDGTLQNTLVVENRMQSGSNLTTPVSVGPIDPTSSDGGHVSGFGSAAIYRDQHGGSGFGSGTSEASAQVAGLAAYLWAIRPDLPGESIKEVILNNARRVDGGADAVDAYASVLALDNDPQNAQVRLAILDVTGPGGVPDNRFDQLDAITFLNQFAAPSAGQSPDYSRYDLNGDGYTGGDATSSFDLDLSRGGTLFPLPLTKSIGGVAMTFDEGAVTDLQVLCYYVYSPLFSGGTGGIAAFEAAAQSLGLSCVPPPPEIRINTASCSLQAFPFYIDGIEYSYHLYQIRVSGTATGPVGAWVGFDEYVSGQSCSTWGVRSGGACERYSGNAASTSWSADLVINGGDSGPGSSGFLPPPSEVAVKLWLPAGVPNAYYSGPPVTSPLSCN
jgi:hypothetical protein